MTRAREPRVYVYQDAYTRASCEFAPCVASRGAYHAATLLRQRSVRRADLRDKLFRPVDSFPIGAGRATAVRRRLRESVARR